MSHAFDRRRAISACLAEALEPRTLLSLNWTPPALADLDDAVNHSVVVVETNFGDIFLELFDDTTPATVANFLNYIQDGDIDESFFHRLVSGFIIQAGGFFFDNGVLAEVPEDDPVDNEFNNHAAMTGSGATVITLGAGAARVTLPSGTSMADVQIGDWLQLPNLPLFDANMNEDVDLYEITNVEAALRRITIATPSNIQNQVSQEWRFYNPVNVERTLSMAKLGGQPDSATSQLFINLADNSDNLDLQNDGFTVFARVADDASWAVVQTIAGFPTVNYDPSQQGGDGLLDAMTDVPVNPSYNDGDPLGPGIVVEIVNIEVAKPAGTDDFYGFFSAMTEGFRGATIVEDLHILNPETTPNFYQVILHTEVDNRDEVVFAGSIGGSGSAVVAISDFNDTSLDLVPEGTPYSIEVHSTQALGASLRRTDFGTTTGEALTDFSLFDSTTEAALQDWTLERVTRDAGPVAPNTESFVVWVNLTDADATMTVTFRRIGAAPITIDRTLEAYRRGGLNINDCPWLPDGDYTISVSSDQPILATFSSFTNTATPTGYSANGMLGGAAVEGTLAGAIIQTGSSPFLSFTNADASISAVVQVVFRFSDGNTIPHNFGLAAGQRTDIDLATTLGGALPVDEFFTITYKVVAGPAVSATYISALGEDANATPFAVAGAPVWAFADAFYDPSRPSDQASIVSIYNPYDPDAADDFGYSIWFHFSDGTVIKAATESLANFHRVDIDLGDLATGIPALVAKLASGAQFHEFGIQVLAFGLQGSAGVAGGGVVQYTFSDLASPSNSFTTSMGSLLEDPVFLDDPIYDGGGGA